MKSLGIIWTVAINLIAVGVALAIFNSLSGKFEIIIVSICVLIYINLQALAMRVAMNAGTQAFYIAEEFRIIKSRLPKRKTLEDEILGEIDDEEEIRSEEIDQSREKFEKAKTKMAINDGFLLLVYIIVIWNLLSII